MILLSEYYEEKLYPFQDGVLNILNQSGTNFFLTGGTALSRAYYNHRYSDDLDFFLCKEFNYDEELNAVLALLREAGYVWDTDKNYVRNKYFTTLIIGNIETDPILKLDFVKDTVPHFGDIINTDLFFRTDSIRNIISNKLSAIYRYAAKDIADIREIALHETFDWSLIIHEARHKEAGLELVYISEIMKDMPEKEFETIAWKKKPLWKEFQQDIIQIVSDMINCTSGNKTVLPDV